MAYFTETEDENGLKRTIVSQYGTAVATNAPGTYQKPQATLAGTTTSLGIAQPALPPGTPAPAAPKLPQGSITPPPEALAANSAKPEPRLTPGPLQDLATASPTSSLDKFMARKPTPTQPEMQGPPAPNAPAAASPNVAKNLLEQLNSGKLSFEQAQAAYNQMKQPQGGGAEIQQMLEMLPSEKYHFRQSIRDKYGANNREARKFLRGMNRGATAAPQNGSDPSAPIIEDWAKKNPQAWSGYTDPMAPRD